MPIDMRVLDPRFAAKLDELFTKISGRGVKLVPYTGLRLPDEQARLWSQSRSAEEINDALHKLRLKAPKITAMVRMRGAPLLGRWATNFLPGQSWHQWGEAVDCCVLNSIGQAVWASHFPPYMVYAEEALKAGLAPGMLWKSRDAQHVQLRKESVRDLYTWEEVETEMNRRYVL